MTARPVVVEQTYGVTVEELWQAITEPDQMRQWFFEAMGDFEAKPGFEVQFNVRCDGQDYLHRWLVTEVLAGKRIVYGWRYDGHPGDSTVTWELSETPEGAKLTFAHQGIETFPQDNPVFRREATQAGWDYFLGGSLKTFLDRRHS